MKRILITLAVMLGFAVAAVAQPKAVGIRFGYGVEASYQHSLGNNFVEANLGLEAFNALNVAATYNWMIAQPQWTDRGEGILCWCWCCSRSGQDNPYWCCRTGRTRVHILVSSSAFSRHQTSARTH